VVADTKTPTSWKAGACYFLSVQDQYRLPFNSPRHIPYRAYTRKNLGYLYAIALGAETIFDTDDDNDINDLQKGIRVVDPDDPIYQTVFNPHLREDTAINPYKHFGRSDIWPRGYPLEQINSNKNYSIAATNMMPTELQGRALVLQGLADLDPDVDAIFRLTNPEDIATVHFDKTAGPIKLARGIASPFNSQNTLWHKDAFWGLLLPITVTFRATDIMRGYWSQRLLWDIGATLAFGPPTVDQVRNAHDYISDMESELELYIHVGKFITFLQTWTSTATRLDYRIIDLGRSMVAAEFIKQADLDLMEAWISDLRTLNYEWPELQLFDLEAAASAAETKAPDYHRIGQEWKEAASDPAFPNFPDTLMVVQFNFAHYGAIEPFLNLYSRFYPNIVFYGPQAYEVGDIKVTAFDNWASGAGGGTSYRAAVQAYKEHPNYGSYLFTNDDVVFDPFAVQKLDREKIWHPVWEGGQLRHITYTADTDFKELQRTNWHWWGTSSASTIAIDAIEEINAAQPGRMPNELWVNQGDIFYVPSRYAEEFFGLLDVFGKHGAWLEVAVATTVHAMPSDRVETSMPASGISWVWFGERLKFAEHLNSNMFVYHPLKLASSKHRPDVEPNVELGVAQKWLLDSLKHSKDSVV